MNKAPYLATIFEHKGLVTWRSVSRTLELEPQIAKKFIESLAADIYVLGKDKDITVQQHLTGADVMATFVRSKDGAGMNSIDVKIDFDQEWPPASKLREVFPDETDIFDNLYIESIALKPKNMSQEEFENEMDLMLQHELMNLHRLVHSASQQGTLYISPSQSRKLGKLEFRICPPGLNGAHSLLPTPDLSSKLNAQSVNSPNIPSEKPPKAEQVIFATPQVSKESDLAVNSSSLIDSTPTVMNISVSSNAAPTLSTKTEKKKNVVAKAKKSNNGLLQRGGKEKAADVKSRDIIHPSEPIDEKISVSPEKIQSSYHQPDKQIDDSSNAGLFNDLEIADPVETSEEGVTCGEIGVESSVMTDSKNVENIAPSLPQSSMKKVETFEIQRETIMSEETDGLVFDNVTRKKARMRSPSPVRGSCPTEKNTTNTISIKSFFKVIR